MQRTMPSAMEAMTPTPTRWTCPACKTLVLTPFCAQCGESPLKPRDLTLRGLFGKLLHAVTSIDGKLLRTFWRLLRHPGTVTVDYLTGNRKPYIAPFQLFLVANVLFFAVQSLTSTNIFGSPLDSHLHHQDWSALAQSLVDRHLQKHHTTLAEYAPVFDRAVVLNAKSLIILMVLPFGLLLALVFIGRRKPFIAHVVFSLHLYTFLLLLFTVAVVAAAVNLWLGGAGLASARVDNVLSVINLLACAAYLGMASARAYGDSGVMRWVRVALLALAAGAIVLGYRFVIFLITLVAT